MASPSTPEKDHVYVSLLKSIRTIDVDWKKFTTETGIKATGNAQRKLKENLKKDGLTLVAGNIVPYTGETDVKKPKPDTKETKADTKKPKTTPKRKTKRDDSDEDYEVATPSKKAKVQDALQSDGDDD